MAQIEFFTPASGFSPIKKFIDRCETKQQVKILRFLEYLEEFGLTRTIPNVKKLSGAPLWEVRILGRDNFRIFCASLGKDKVIILHIFAKKKQKIPKKEINLALRRYFLLIDK